MESLEQRLSANAQANAEANAAEHQKLADAVSAEREKREKDRLERADLVGQPLQGRIVILHSTNPGECGVAISSAPAIITQVLSEGRLNLHVFRNGENAVPMTMVRHAIDAQKSGADRWWDWPANPLPPVKAKKG